MAYIKQLQNEDGINIYPKTLAEAITNVNGGTLEDVVEELVNNIPAPSLKKVYLFTTESWSGPSDGFYSYDVAAATHGLGIDVITDVYTLDGTLYYKIVAGQWSPYDCTVVVDATGNISLKTEVAFNGKLIVV